MKNLLLVGGGHSHAILMRMCTLNPIPGVRLTLVTDNLNTPYSGMLPGHIAGLYTYEECHINLQNLANIAEARLYIDRVVNLDLDDKKVICENLPAIDFDILSFDIGSTPATINVPGALEYAIRSKPVPRLLEEWEKLCSQIKNYQSPIRIAVVGGGAGGVELALAMQAKFAKDRQVEVHLFHRNRELMPNYHSSLQRMIKIILLECGIYLHLGETVTKVEKPEKFNIVCDSGLTLEFDRVFWVTQAHAPQWLKTTGLTTDEKGFILVADTLQSLSHPNVFAAGDIATMKNHPRPKAGVFAVRQGKPLYQNLRSFAIGDKLKPYIPQRHYLSLIGTGDAKAIANRGGLTLPPMKLLWRWKDSIDKKFMRQFEI